MANATCFTQHAPFQGPPLIQNGQLTFQAHDVGWIIAGFFTIVATIASFWLIGKHLMWYTNKRQQRYIIRLLLMVPIYGTVSLASFIFWNHAIPITLARDCYESFVLYSFFYLLLQYLSPTVEGQKEVFRHVVLEKWVFPLGFVKYRPEDGLYFLQLMKWGVLQYCVIRPTTTLAAVILDFIGLYCEDSWSPGWGHVYITIIVSLSVTIAMYCLIQLYMPISPHLPAHKPLLKLFSVKAVVFLTFWQATGLSALSMFGVVKDTKYMTAEDINTGIAAILETFEMMCFAFLHVKAFSYHPYRDGRKPNERTPRFRSFMHALDLRDMWREIRDGSVYMGRTMRGVEAEEEARRRIHFARVMGRERELSEAKPWTKEGRGAEEDVSEDDLLLVKHGRRRDQARREMWLSEPGDRFGGAFEDEVEREMQRRELSKKYGGRRDVDGDIIQGHARGQSSWWKGIYDRLSQSEARDHEDRLSPVPGRPSRTHHSRKHRRRGSELPSLDSPPPQPSIMYEHSNFGTGRPSVRVKPPGDARDHRSIYDAPREPRVGHHYHQHHNTSGSGLPCNGHTNMYLAKGQVPAPARPIAAPRPVSASQSRHIELLVSGEHRPLSANVQSSASDCDNDRVAAPSAIVRSDSLLARVFPNTSTDGHAASEGRTNPTSSHETLSTQMMYPSGVSPPSVKLVSRTRGEHPGPFATPTLPSPVAAHPSTHMQSSQSPPKPGKHDSRSPSAPKQSRPRSDIVLPTPLSPARYPAESERHAQAPQQNSRRPSAQSQQATSYPDPSQPAARSYSRGFPQTSSTRDPSTPRRSDQSDRWTSSRRHSTQVERPLTRAPRASKRMSAPLDGLPTRTHPTPPPRLDDASRFSPSAAQTAENDALLPAWSLPSDYSRYPTSPTGNGMVPSLTTPPSPSLPTRPLRRSRDDVGKARRPWS